MFRFPVPSTCEMVFFPLESTGLFSDTGTRQKRNVSFAPPPKEKKHRRRLRKFLASFPGALKKEGKRGRWYALVILGIFPPQPTTVPPTPPFPSFSNGAEFVDHARNSSSSSSSVAAAGHTKKEYCKVPLDNSRKSNSFLSGSGANFL